MNTLHDCEEANHSECEQMQVARRQPSPMVKLHGKHEKAQTYRESCQSPRRIVKTQ